MFKLVNHKTGNVTEHETADDALAVARAKDKKTGEPFTDHFMVQDGNGEAIYREEGGVEIPVAGVKPGKAAAQGATRTTERKPVE